MTIPNVNVTTSNSIANESTASNVTASNVSATNVTSPANVVLEAHNVTKTFPQPDGRGAVTVLNDISLSVYEGEVIAILGRSGSGKSTFLRVLAGLLQPTSGTVLSGGTPLNGPNADVTMVFQSFALLPWLTVLQNVELGLQARGVGHAERRKRALKAIDMIGLDGFEEAFPKELSSGMKQRVGFARALVVEPTVLMMDEPFSALDVLTAATLRQKIEELWTTHAVPIKAIVVVTHNIDEAVTLADRIIVFGANPGCVRIEVRGLPLAERTKTGPARTRLMDGLYRIMTNPDVDAQSLLTKAAPSVGKGPGSGEEKERERKIRRRRYQTLPDVSVDNLTGFVQYLAGIGGSSNLHELSRDLQMRVDVLFGIVEASDLLGFVDMEERQVQLTDTGGRLARGSLDEKKALFRSQALAHVSLLQEIFSNLEIEPSKTLSAERVLDDLEHAFNVEEARNQFETAVDWGRFAELFTYDNVAGEFRLDEAYRGGSGPGIQTE